MRDATRSERTGPWTVGTALTVSAIVVVAMFALSAWAWGRIAGDRIPVHWGINGQPDGYGGKFEGLLLVPLITVGIAVLFTVIPRIEPRRLHFAQSMGPFLAVWFAMLAFMAALHVAIVVSAFGHPVDMSVVMGGGIGALSIVIGAVLGRVRSNFLFGVRTPWTLSSERSWRLTHRLAGRLFVASGAATIVAALVALPTGWSALPFVALLAGDIGAALVAVVYSYVVWRDDPDRQRVGA
jgi:uncharacterized membrane protein